MKGDRLTVVLNGITVIENAQLPGVPAQGPDRAAAPRRQEGRRLVEPAVARAVPEPRDSGAALAGLSLRNGPAERRPMSVTPALVALLLGAATATPATAADSSGDGEAAFRALYKELVETNTSALGRQLHARGRGAWPRA